MKLDSLNDIKKQLNYLSHEECVLLLLRLSKHKKENKELLNYLLQYAAQESDFIEAVLKEVRLAFASLHLERGAYVFTKQVRKTLRLVNKYIKFSQQASTEIELLIGFCELLKPFLLEPKPITALLLIYDRQLIRIHKALTKLHEDIAYDYKSTIDQLQLGQ